MADAPWAKCDHCGQDYRKVTGHRICNRCRSAKHRAAQYNQCPTCHRQKSTTSRVCFACAGKLPGVDYRTELPQLAAEAPLMAELAIPEVAALFEGEGCIVSVQDGKRYYLALTSTSPYLTERMQQLTHVGYVRTEKLVKEHYKITTVWACGHVLVL